MGSQVKNEQIEELREKIAAVETWPRNGRLREITLDRLNKELRKLERRSRWEQSPPSEPHAS